jgi:multicomponent Na+:H+ antiporter subunit D
VGVYALLRLFGQVFPAAMADWQAVLGAVAVATMLAGALGAAWHWDLRRILAFHIVSQIGYLILAVALATPAGYAAAIFYTIHHIIVKANLFLIAALVCRVAGSYDLRRIGGVAAARPMLAIIFAVPALSLVGIPPLSGFWAKFLVLRESFAGGHWVWGGAALATGVLTLYSMSKIWIEAFWKPHPAPVAVGRLPLAALASVALLAAITAGIGLFPQTLLGFAGQAAAGLTEVAR